MTDFILERHDIGVLRQDGSTQVPMMLFQKNGTPVYQVFDDEFLAAQFFNAAPGYSNLPAEKELNLIQESWRAGFGLEVFDSSEPERYYSSIGMDLRHRGMGIAGWNTTGFDPTSTLVMSVGITNGDMELDANWTGGAQGANPYRGTKSWDLTNTDSFQNVTFSAGFQGKIAHFGCWVKSSSVSNGRISINDGVDTTFSSYHTGGGVYERLTVSHTMNGAATRLRFQLHADIAASAFFDDASTIEAGTVKALAEFNDILYISWANTLFKVTSGSGTPALVETFMADITDLESFVTDSKLYIALGASVEYDNMDTSEVINATDSFATFFKAERATMWKALLPREIFSATDPSADANWSAATEVGSASDNITDFLTFDNALYIMKEDRPYFLDSSGNVQILTNITRSIGNSTSGKNSLEFLGKIYMPWGTQSLLESDSGTFTFRDPSDFTTNLSEFIGRVQALGGDDRYLYAIVDNSGKVEVMAGRLETIGASTFWVWHPIHELTLTNCETAFVSNVFQKRLWIASDTTGESLFYLPLPTNYGDIVNDSNADFLSGTLFLTPFLHANFRDTDKAHIKIDVLLGHTFDADIYFEVHYKKLEDTAFTDAGDLKGTATNRRATIFFPNDASSNKPVSTMFQLKFVAITDDTSKTPILSSYNVKAILYPPQREIIACQVRAGANVVDKEGTELEADQAFISTVLDEARNATFPLSFFDIDGNTKSVKFLPLPSNVPRWILTKDEKERTQERVYNLLLEIVDLS